MKVHRSVKGESWSSNLCREAGNAVGKRRQERQIPISDLPNFKGVRILGVSDMGGVPTLGEMIIFSSGGGTQPVVLSLLLGITPRSAGVCV